MQTSDRATCHPHAIHISRVVEVHAAGDAFMNIGEKERTQCAVVVELLSGLPSHMYAAMLGGRCGMAFNPLSVWWHGIQPRSMYGGMAFNPGVCMQLCH